MQMYLFDDSFGFANVNGGDDSGVVWHEYTHGLSNRLVLNADGSGALSTAQAGAMGEAWSDWFASDLQVALGFKDDTSAPGEIDVGEYTDLVPHTLRTQGLESHLPVMCDFWETVLFRTGLYRGNALVVHRRLDLRHPLYAKHFARWLAIWEATVDDMYDGPAADRAKLQAGRIARAMHRRLRGVDARELDALAAG